MPRRQDHEGLDDLAANRVGAGHYRRLGHGRVLHQGALDLERPDAIAGADDDIIRPPHEPEVSIRIFDGAVARDVPVATDTVGGSLRVAPVFLEDADRPRGRQLHGDIPFRPRWNFTPFVVHHADREARAGFAHRPRLYWHGRKVDHQARRFGLPVAVADSLSCPALPGLDHLRIERLSCADAVAEGGELITGGILEDKQ